MTAKEMAASVLEVTAGWDYDGITIGYPGPVVHDRPAAEPHNLGRGWVGFSYDSAFPKPVRFMNDAAMQALGGYQGGKMLFLGVGTGLGTALIVDGQVIPLEMAHLPYKKGKTYEEYIGLGGLERRGKRRWSRSVLDVTNRLRTAFVADYVLLGGGNAKLLKTYPPGVMLGANSNAIAGGIALWQEKPVPAVPVSAKVASATDAGTDAAAKRAGAKGAAKGSAKHHGKAGKKSVGKPKAKPARG